MTSKFRVVLAIWTCGDYFEGTWTTDLRSRMDLGLEHAIEWCSLHGIECMERLESREQEKIPKNQQSESQSQNTVQVGENRIRNDRVASSRGNNW